MTIQLHIENQIIEEIPISFHGCRCSEEKAAKLQATAEWLKHKYRQSILIKNNWEIVAIQESRIGQVT